MVVEETNNHGFKTQDKGDLDWHIALNDTIKLLDEKVLLKDSAVDRPPAGTEGRAFLEIDTGKLRYDNGSSWLTIIDNYTDADAKQAVNNDSDHGSSASHNYYTDEQAQDAVGNNSSGGNALTFTYDDAAGTFQYAVDSNSIGTGELDTGITPDWTGKHNFTAGLDAGSNVISSVSDPSNPQEAATKKYVDSIKQGLEYKDSVKLASTGNIDLSSSTDPISIDGSGINDGDRILLKDQTDATENGIYVAVDSADPTTWERSDDADEDSEINEGLFTFVEQGTENGDKSFVLITENPITLGTDDINFSIFTSAGAIQAGDGLNKSGNILSTDLSYSPVWTSEHQFDAGIKITDGQAIEDSNGDDRIGLSASEVDVKNSDLNLNGNEVTAKALDSHVSEVFPRATLEDGETIEKDIPVNDGETLTVYRWGAHRTSDNTAPTSLEIELLNDGDTSQLSQNTVDNENTNGITSISNSSGNISFYTIRITNNTGSTEDVAGHFEVEVS